VEDSLLRYRNRARQADKNAVGCTTVTHQAMNIATSSTGSQMLGQNQYRSCNLDNQHFNLSFKKH